MTEISINPAEFEPRAAFTARYKFEDPSLLRNFDNADRRRLERYLGDQHPFLWKVKSVIVDDHEEERELIVGPGELLPIDKRVLFFNAATVGVHDWMANRYARLQIHLSEAILDTRLPDQGKIEPEDMTDFARAILDSHDPRVPEEIDAASAQSSFS